MANGANYNNVIAQASQKYGIPDSLLTAQINQESGFNPNAVSPAGAEGIAQFMPATAQSIGLKNPFDPTEAIPAMAKYDAQNFNQFGNITKMLEAYNEGPNAVANGVIAPGVKSYANNIINAANGTQPTTTTTKSVCVTMSGVTDCPNNSTATTPSSGTANPTSHTGTGTGKTAASCGISDTPLITMPVTGTPLLTPCGLWDLAVGVLGLILVIAGFKQGAVSTAIKMIPLE